MEHSCISTGIINYLINSLIKKGRYNGIQFFYAYVRVKKVKCSSFTIPKLLYYFKNI